MIKKLRILRDIIELTDYKVGLEIVKELIVKCEKEHPEEVIGYTLVTYDELTPLYYCGYFIGEKPFVSSFSQEAAVYLDDKNAMKALESLDSNFKIEEYIWS